MRTSQLKQLVDSKPVIWAEVSSVSTSYTGLGVQSNHDSCTTFPSESTVKVFRHVCIPSLSFQSVSHVSTLRPSESAAVLSGAPHEASSRASGTPTHLLITSLVALVVVHALNGNKSGSAAMQPKFNENDLANLRATDERCVLRVFSG